jgi:hypothetical protein
MPILKKLCSLRSDVERGIRSLDAGAGKTLDIGEVIERARAPEPKP